MNRKLIGLALASVLGCATSACATSTEDATVELGVASESSALQAADGTAAPEAGAAAHPSAHVRITVKEIRLHVAGSDDGSKGNSAGKGAAANDDDAADGDGKDSGNGWVTVFSGDRTIELDHTATLDSILGSAHAKPGKITQLRLVLDGQAVLVEGAVETPIACASCDTSGLKIIPRGDARLESGGHHHFVIAFDIDKSIVDEAGQVRMKPVLRIAQGN